MTEQDYSVYYRRFHSTDEDHALRMSQAAIYALAPHVPEDRTVPIIDIGCGFGFALRALREMGFTDLTGFETSEQQAKICREAGFNVIVSENPNEWLQTQSTRYGFALLADVLEHLPVSGQIAFLRAIRETLRPGGQLYVTVPNANAILASRWRYNDHTHHSSFTEHSLHYVLENAGYGSVNISSEKGLGRFSLRLWRTENRASLRRWIVRWCWLQVHKGEIPWERLEDVSFELNLTAVAVAP